ncbi:hypothetical protein J5N97_023959 [Dioscorea zingiberensis]|uniref:Cystatin domain-containing protein n=1 Tax=Dioscorea zingiberensis TaxID=325984 RepID=A0A9D5C5Q3_9LILI|nr:hypothetical protein J5N97_023959 [Dioscorea zingiberensis]
MAARIPLILLAATALTAFTVFSTGRMLGGLTEINNVVSNELVHSLGKFAVENYNRNQEKNKAPPTRLFDTGTIVGGVKDINNVESNELVQSLGKFAVENYNRNQEKNKAPATTLLSFSHVIAAKWQFVEGRMYHMKIVAEDSHHARKVFDAKVTEKPWLKSKKVVSFTPSAH